MNILNCIARNFAIKGFEKSRDQRFPFDAPNFSIIEIFILAFQTRPTIEVAYFHVIYRRIIWNFVTRETR